LSGSTETLVDAFYVKKDTSGPIITDNQAGDDTWRNASGTTYNIDFADAYALIDSFQIKITTGPNQTGTLISDWQNVAADIDSTDYTTNWALPSGTWELLQETTNYVNVRSSDTIGNLTTTNDAFVVLKDTTNPTVTEQVTDDNDPVTSSGKTYDVDFNDTGGSLLDYVQYTVWTQENRSGGEVLPWTDIALSINATYYDTDWEIDYNLIPNDATSYVSVRVYDSAANLLVDEDVFKVIKQGLAPSITDNQPGDDTWRDENDGIYDVDFQAQSGLPLDKFQVQVTTGTNGDRTTIVDWTDVVTGIDDNSYNTNWSVPSAVFNAMVQGVNDISVRVYDTVPTTSTAVDIFYVKKDTGAPTVDN